MRRLILLVAYAITPLAQAQIWEKPIMPGLLYRMEVDSATPRVIHALRWRPGNSSVSVHPELCGGTVYENNESKGRGTLPNLVTANEGVAGINGDYFPFTGDPLGAMVRNGQIISKPDLRRTVFGWGPNGATFAPLNWKARLVLSDGQSIPITAINEDCGDNELVLNTPASGFAAGKTPNLHALIQFPAEPLWAPTSTVEGTFSVFTADKGMVKVAPNACYLTARGTSVKQLLKLKQKTKVKIVMETTGMDWKQIDSAVGGGPMLVSKGAKTTAWQAEGFKEGLANNRHPRSAVGTTKAGDVWFVVVDGRQSMSAGATLNELGDILLKLGCTDGMNLDGGGSSEMVLLGQTLNRPSDGTHREIANGIVFLGPKAPVGEGQMVLKGPIAIDGAHLARYQLIGSDGEPVPNDLILWSAVGAAWIDQGGTVRGATNGKATVIATAFGRSISVDVTVKNQLAEAVPQPAKSVPKKRDP